MKVMLQEHYSDWLFWVISESAFNHLVIYSITPFGHQMEASDGEEHIRDADRVVAPPNGGMNELLNVGQEDNIQGQVSSAVLWKTT